MNFHCGPATTESVIFEKITVGHPFIAYLLQKVGDNRIKHGVVVTGYSDDKTKVYINDPKKSAPISLSIGDFIDEWQRMQKYILHVTISEGRSLPDYIAESGAK